jgi:ribonuclease I
MNCLKWISDLLNSAEDSTETIETQPNNFYYLCLINDTGSSWSIHGLWPQYSQGSYPTYCKKVTFDINALEPIMDKLKQEWYSTEEPNSDFWKHEWEKHGSCMFTNMNELQYFSKALELFDSIKNNTELINKFQKNNSESMIPFDQDFNIIM